MDIYHVWADKSSDISDTEWIKNMQEFLDYLVREDRMISYRVTRCKMGFRSIQDLPEWHIMMEFRDMAQLERAFQKVALKTGELEDHHRSFNQFVGGNIQHAYYRDWPDQF